MNCSNVVFKVQQQLAKLQKHLQNKIGSLKRLFMQKTSSDQVSFEAPLYVASVCHTSVHLNIFFSDLKMEPLPDKTFKGNRDYPGN